MGRHDETFRLIAKSLVFAAGLVLLVLALLRLRHLLVLAFGAVVIGVLIHALAEGIRRRTPLGRRGGFYAALAVILLVVGGFGWLLGTQVSGQFSQLTETIPPMWERIEVWMGNVPGGNALIESVEGFTLGDGGWVPSMPQLLSSATTVVTDLLLLLFGAVFIAHDPGLYRRGLTKLVPKRRRSLADEVLGETGEAIRLWMTGQFMAMVAVGGFTALGLWLVGVPAPLALGLIIGFLEIIPWLGPFLGAIPILIMALAEGPQTALFALGVILVVQQLEGSFITPYVQKKVVSIPPAVTVFGVIAGGVLFGVVGLFFAAPLLIVCYTLVKRLYVEEALGTPTPVPGRDELS